MELNGSQLTILRTWLDANAQNMGDQEAANALNLIASPDYFAWRTSVGKHEVTEQTALDTDGVTVTQFQWSGNGGYIARSAAERDCWKELFNTSLNMRPNLANVRTAFADIFSGGGEEAAMNRSHLWGISLRTVTVGEQLFVVETVGGPAQSGDRGTRTNPDTLVVEGEMSAQNVVDAWSL